MPTLAEILAAKKQPKPEATPAPATTIKITPESEHAAAAARIKATLDATAPKPAPPLPDTGKRELGAMAATGERIPMDHPGEGAPPEEWEWFDSLHSFVTDICIVIEPSPSSHAWLAIKARPWDPPLLLHRLPVVNRPEGKNPF
jgi:hypothetical protein